MSQTQHIVVLDPLAISDEQFDALSAPLREAGHRVTRHPGSDALETQIAWAQEADILVITNRPLPGELVRACQRLRFIAVAFSGVDHVDLEACRAAGIQVANASGYATAAVAELTLAMMVDRLRQVSEMEAALRAGGTRAGFAGRELGECTVGLIGLGQIGRRVATLLRAYGATTIGYLRRSAQADDPVCDRWLPLDALLAESDIVSLHCPLTPETRGLIDAEAIARMRRGAILVNTARGPVIDDTAVVAALETGQLGGLATDVFDREPPLDPGHPLLQAPHVLATPHIAYASEEAMQRRAARTFANISAWLSGQPQHLVSH